tara:strand:- start:824 stop:1564 length:741 start_codon:yes stop_codon:yes gene_type:complete
MATPDTEGLHHVFLNLQSMNNDGDDDGFIINRVALKAESISISTTKNVMAMPLPFSGVVTGESSTLALDFGVATKNISLSGILTEQTIIKRFEEKPENSKNDAREADSWGLGSLGEKTVSVTLTANEVAQLIHSYVDSSFLQEQQNFTSIIILIDSYVNKNFAYHNALVGGKPVSELIPFTYKTRGADDSALDAGPFQRGSFPDKVSSTSSDSLTGFVRSFNTTHTPGQPYIEFSLEFEVAINPFG